MLRLIVYTFGHAALPFTLRSHTSAFTGENSERTQYLRIIMCTRVQWLTSGTHQGRQTDAGAERRVGDSHARDETARQSPVPSRLY